MTVKGLLFAHHSEEDLFMLDDDTLEAQSQAIDNDDLFLPDDYEQGVQEETQAGEEPVEETKPTEPEPQKIKIKYNHEEQEIPLEEAILLAQKGMNYDKLQERLNSMQTDPRLSFVEELASENNMTVDEYLQAVKEQREQQRLNELIQQNIPEEIAKEIMESRKFRDEVKSKEKALQEEQQKKQWEENNQKMFKEAFPDVTDIPQDVLEKYNQGLPLKYAYMEHAYNQAVQKLKIYEQNEKNNGKAPVGSVTSHGGQEIAPEDEFLRGFNSI